MNAPALWFCDCCRVAVLAALLVALPPELRGVANDNATGLLMPTLLTPGTFIAGIHG